MNIDHSLIHRDPGLRGLGDCTPITDPATGDVIDTVCDPNNPLPPSGGGSSGGSAPMGSGGSGGSSSGSPSWTPAQLAQLLGVAGSAAGNAIMAAQAPAGYVFNSRTGTYQLAVGGMQTGAPGLTTTTVGIGGSMLPVILGAAAVLGLVLILKK